MALIRDDRERGLAQIALDREALEKRLDLVGLNAEERQRIEEDLARWQWQREQQLTEQLKPEWQRRMEAWGDTTRLMKESYDTLMGGIVSEGENAFAQFMRTGKLNTRGLVDFMISEFARLEYRKNLAPLVSNGADSLLNFLGLAAGMTIDTTGYGIGGTRTDGGIGLPTRGGAATGSNELERDMITLVHKGEAIVPREFNPWAGGGGAQSLGGNQVVQHITYNVPDGYTPAMFATAIEQNNQALKGEIAGDMARPGRLMNRAARLSRF